MNSAFEISKNPLNCKPISSGWAVHELRQLVHYKRYIRLSEREILHRTNDLTVFSGISWRCPIMQLKGHSGRDRGGNCISTKHIMCRPSILSLQHMSLSSLLMLHNSSLVAHYYSQYLPFFESPRRLWLRDFSNSIVTLGSFNLDLSFFSFLFRIAFRCIFRIAHLDPFRCTQPTQVHLDTLLDPFMFAKLAQLHGLHDLCGLYKFLYYFTLFYFIISVLNHISWLFGA